VVGSHSATAVTDGNLPGNVFHDDEDALIHLLHGH
jgi:hypothetical protein